MNDQLVAELKSRLTALAGQYKTIIAEKNAQIQANRSQNLSGSVGQGGQNLPNDVRLVQQLLNRVGAKLVDDGAIGPKTIAAIHAYQKALFQGWSDGRIDPGGSTWQNLLAGKGAQANLNPNPTPSPGFDAAFLAALQTAYTSGKGSISQGVGQGQANAPEDVLIVKALLKFRANYAFSYDPNTLHTQTQLHQADSAFIQAIANFQQAKGLAAPDKVLSPGGTGMQILNGQRDSYNSAAPQGPLTPVDAGSYERFDFPAAGGVILTLPKGAQGSLHLLIVIGGLYYAKADWMRQQVPGDYFKSAALLFMNCKNNGGKGVATAMAAAQQVLNQKGLSIKSQSICGFSGGGPEAGANPSAYKAVGLIDPTPVAVASGNTIMYYNHNNWTTLPKLYPLFIPLANKIKAAGGVAEYKAWPHKNFPAAFFSEQKSAML
jgi:hypothetical protein